MTIYFQCSHVSRADFHLQFLKCAYDINSIDRPERDFIILFFIAEGLVNLLCLENKFKSNVTTVSKMLHVTHF